MRSQGPPHLQGGSPPLLFKLQGAWSQMRVRLALHLPPSVPNCPHHRDEYGQVKSVKLLRRGRRLQQAEYVQFLVRQLLPVAMHVLIPLCHLPGLSTARSKPARTMTLSSPDLHRLQTSLRCQHLPFLNPCSGGASYCNVSVPFPITSITSNVFSR